MVFANRSGNEMGFPLLIGCLVVQHPFAAAVLCPQGFTLALAVVADNSVGGIKNDAGAAVVLFQSNDHSAAELLLKRKDILNSGTTELVDALVIITDNAQVAVTACQQADQQVLGVVGILILIDHDIAVAALVLLQHLRELLEQLDRQQNDVIKIEGVGFAQHLLIARVHPRGDLQSEIITGGTAQVIRRKELILGTADIAEERLGRKILIADVQLCHGVLDDSD